MTTTTADSSSQDDDLLDFTRVIETEQREVAGLRPPGESLGLAFSGGGIRSATFNLGVIQALAEQKLLQRFDYLSTVSGGGYIGSWLSALIHRRAEGNVKNVEDLVVGVQAPQETTNISPQTTPKHTSGTEAITEDRAIRWLRAYSNYLTPRLGLFSGDSQAAIATWLRNFFLNMTVLISLLSTVLLLPWLLQRFGAWLAGLPGFTGAYEKWLLFLLSFPPVLVITSNLVRETSGDRSDGVKPWYMRGWALVWMVVAPILISAWLGTEYLAVLAKNDYADFKSYRDTAIWRKYSALAYVAIWLISLVVCAWRRRSGLGERLRQVTLRMIVQEIKSYLSWSLKFIFFAAMAGVLAGQFFKWLADVFGSFTGEQGPLLVFVFGTPLFLVVVLIVVTIHIGLMAKNFSDQHHEFWSRIGGMFQRVILLWLIVAGVSVFGAPLIDWLAVWAMGGGIAWIASSLVGVWLGKSAATGTTESRGWREIIAQVAPYIFIFGFLGLLAWGIHHGFVFYGKDKRWFEGAACCSYNPAATNGGEPGIYLLAPMEPGKTVTTEREIMKPTALEDLRRHIQYNSCLMSHIHNLVLVVVLSGLFVVTVLLGFRINVNLYSLHNFYRNRLMCCYLGATNGKRDPNPVTGLDPNDDLELKVLRQRPYPIINTAINLNAGHQLAWQHRRAASFVFTPLFTGYEPASKNFKAGFRPTSKYAVGTDGKSVRVGTAVATSGAAVSPNWGFHTNPAVAFLLTVFNVRMGRWCGDTKRKKAWREEDPLFSLRYWVSEMMGQADVPLPFVYLSDGGHFENLGIYELVRRRCQLIVACDAGADPKYIFDDLGEAIRKCHIDFGVEITINVGSIIPDKETGFSKLHYALGDIHYERARYPLAMGRLIYVKASVTKDMPTDLRNYKSEHPDFPHQTTIDQFFDEAQFESYRKLGYEAARNSINNMRDSNELPLALS